MHQQRSIRAISFRGQNAIRAEEGFTLLASVVLTLFLGVLIGAAFMSMNMQLRESEQRIASHDSFYSAEAGLEEVVFLLRQNISWRPDPSHTGTIMRVNGDPATTIGRFTVRIASPSAADRQASGISFPYVLVRSDGDDAAGQAPRSILARVVLLSPTNFLAFTLGTLVIRSGAVYDNDILARDVNFVVDSSLPSGPARNITVNGSVNYLRSISGNTAPEVTITDGVQPSPSVTFTGVDLARFRALTTPGANQYSSSYTVSGGTINRLNQNSANGVVFVEGDLHLSGTYENDMVFVASGNIYLDGNITAAAGSGPKPQLGLFSAGDVIIPAGAPTNINIEAFILADGGVFKAERSAGTKNSLTFTGAMSVRGREGQLGVDLNTYASRSYSYNPNFTASTIPFLPSIANVVTWTEINPNDPFPPA